MTEIRIAITPETLALLEMSMSEGDTYDAVIMRLMKTPWRKTKDGWECEKRAIQRMPGNDDFTISLPEGMRIDPGAITALKTSDDEPKLSTAQIPPLWFWQEIMDIMKSLHSDISRTADIESMTILSDSAVSVVVREENIAAMHTAVKAVFDE